MWELLLVLRPAFRCDAICNASVLVVITKTDEIWLVNKGSDTLDLIGGELFGFNVGSFAEAATGLP